MKPALITAVISLLLTTSGSAFEERKLGIPEDPNVRFTSVVKAEDIIHQRVIDTKGAMVGTVADIVVDRSHGRVAFFVVHSRRIKNSIPTSYFLPPSVAASWRDDQRLQLSVDLERVDQISEILNAPPSAFVDVPNLRELYDHYQANPYWTDQNDKPSLLTVSDIHGRLIRDSNWMQLGKVHNVVLAPENGWAVAFVTVGHLKDKKKFERIAVPMGAFATKTVSPVWMLDLPGKTRLLDDTFSTGDSLPKSLNRGWIEFTHVKYGSAAVTGVQDLSEQQ